jgi:HEAT repeat protein
MGCPPGEKDAEGYAEKHTESHMPRRDIEGEIEKLSQLRDAPPKEAAARLRKALGDRVNLVAARAARVIGQMQLLELVPDLLRAFERLMENGAERDPQCWAKNEIAKALVAMDLRDSAPFLRGTRYVQLEKTGGPLGGKLEDMAQNLRGICVLALAACNDLPRSQILRHLVDSLVDDASNVRVEAVRAIEQMDGEEGAMLLRLKARLPEEEPSVIGQTFDSLLALEGGDAAPFVASFLKSPREEVREEAALSLGGSRLPGTFELLRDSLSTTPELRRVLLRAISSARSEEAIEFLLGLVRQGESAALEALALHRGSPDILARVGEAAGEGLSRRFRELFPTSPSRAD